MLNSSVFKVHKQIFLLHIPAILESASILNLLSFNGRLLNSMKGDTPKESATDVDFSDGLPIEGNETIHPQLSDGVVF